MPIQVGQRGIALIVVLWILILLSITVGIYAILARTEGLQARFLFDETAARYAAEAGIHRAVFEMRSTDMETRWVPDGRPYQISIGDAVVEIRIIDESGKINLNAADVELLTDFFISRGVDELEALHLADAIHDWRDPDDMPRLYGAEIDDYLAAGYPYGPANEDFRTVDELQQVIGVSWELYQAVEPLLTVHSGQGRINPAFAPAEVLAAMPDMDRESAEMFVEERWQFHPSDQQALIMPNGQMINLQGGGRTFSIRSRATLDNGIWSEIDATVALGTDTRGRPFRIQRWRERLESR